MSLTTPFRVQKLQTALHAKAKESPNFRFHALYDKKRGMVRLMRHRQTKEPDSARTHLNRRATPRLHPTTRIASFWPISEIADRVHFYRLSSLPLNSCSLSATGALRRHQM